MWVFQTVVAVAEVELRFQNQLNWRFSDWKVRANRFLVLYRSAVLCREHTPASSATATTVLVDASTSPATRLQSQSFGDDA